MRCAFALALLCAAASAQWHSRWDRAKTLSQAQNKPLLLYTWDQNARCAALHGNTPPEFQRVARDFVLASVFSRGVPRNIAPHRVATIQVFAPDGRLHVRMRAENLTLAGVMDVMRGYAGDVRARRKRIAGYVLTFRPVDDALRKKIRALATRLGDVDPAVRDDATRRLLAHGEPAFRILNAWQPKDAETVQRLTGILPQLDGARRTVLRRGLHRDVAWLAEHAPGRLRRIMPPEAFLADTLNWWEAFASRYRWDPPRDRYVAWARWQSVPLRFRGRDSVKVRDSAGSLDLNRPFTIELWVRWIDGGNRRILPLAGNEAWRGMNPKVPVAGTSGFILRRHIFKDRFILDFTAGTMANRWFQVWSRPLGDDRDWLHVAIARDERSMRLFYNGEQVAARRVDSVRLRASPTDIFLGVREYYADKLAGEHDLRSFHMTQACLYRRPFLPPQHPAKDAGSVALLDFARAEGHSVIDTSGRGRHGELRGAKWLAARKLEDAILFEAEEGRHSTAWSVTDRDDSSAGRGLEIWSNFDAPPGRHGGHWVELPFRVPRAGRYRLLLLANRLDAQSSTVAWRVDDGPRAIAGRKAPQPRAGFTTLGERDLSAGPHLFRLRLSRRRMRPDNRWYLRFDALAVQRVKE